MEVLLRVAFSGESKSFLFSPFSHVALGGAVVAAAAGKSCCKPEEGERESGGGKSRLASFPVQFAPKGGGESIFCNAPPFAEKSKIIRSRKKVEKVTIL